MASASTALVAAGGEHVSFLSSLLSTLPFSSSLRVFLTQHVASTVAYLRRRWYLLLPVLLALSIVNRRLLIRPSPPPPERPPSPPPLHRTQTAPALSFKRRRAHSAHSQFPLSSPLTPPFSPSSPAPRTSAPSNAHSRFRFLSQTKYLSSLGEDHLPELFSLMRRRVLAGDEILFTEGEACELGMWVVSKGAIGVFQPNAECALPTPGEDRGMSGLVSSGSPMCVISPGESIGEWTLIGHFPDDRLTYPVRAAALEASEAYFLSRSAFVAFTRRHPRSLLEFVRTAVARQWRIASYVLEHVLELPPRSREEVQGDQRAAMVEWDEMKDATHPAHPEHLTHPQRLHQSTPAPTALSPAPSPSSLDVPGPPPSPPSPLPTFPRGRGVRLLSLEPYDTLFNAGDEAGSLYVVATGALEALSWPTPSSSAVVVGVIPTGCVCGGISFMGSTPRGETIRASSMATTVYEYTRDCIDGLVLDDPASLIPIARAVGRQLAPICQQFMELGLDSRWYRAGSIVYEQGEGSDAVYLVISGRVHAVMGRTNRQADDVDVRRSSEIVFGEIGDSDDPLTPTAAEGEHEVYETLFEAGRGETLGEETSFGDNADQVKRPYTAVCVRDTECVRISQSTFIHLFNLNPRSMLRFARSLSHRVHMLAARSFSPTSLAPRAQPTIATIAIVWIGGAPWGGPRSFILSFGDRLMKELVAHGPCVWVDEERCRREVGESTVNALGDVIHRSRASRWLSELEENHRFIVLETGQERVTGQLTQLFSGKRLSLTGVPPTAPAITTQSDGAETELVSAWTRLCVEQADCVLLVCSSDSEERGVSQYEEQLLWSSASDDIDGDDDDRLDVHLNRYKDLILLHRQSSPAILPTNTKAWLNGRPVRSHHHVRREVQEDYARLARFLAGESIGVVLGGGGARGLAHVGVLQALEEEGVPIDCIGGCSQGALIAALYAKHLRTSDMVPPARAFAGEFTTWGFMKDLTFPLLSYFNGFHFSRVVRTAVGADVMIEDLWLSYYCITTNVRRSDINVHRSGLLWRYCRASMTLLGFLPPVIDDNGDLLLDGGYANNLPVDVMASSASHVHTLIAVDVEDKDLSGFDGLAHLAKRSDFGMSISGLWLLWNKLWGSVRVPDFRQILIFLACLNHSRQLRQAGERKIIDLYIRPPIEGIGLLQYAEYDTIVRKGYEQGKKAIQAWKAEMRKATREAEDAGEDADEVKEERHEAAEDEAQKAISERLRRANHSEPIVSPPKLLHSHKRGWSEERKEEEKAEASDGDDDSDSDDDDGEGEEGASDDSGLPTFLTPHERGEPMLRAMSEPDVKVLGNAGALTFVTSSTSTSSNSSNTLTASARPPIQRNPSMRMLRQQLPTANGLARTDTRTIKSVLRRKAAPLKVGWASDESFRRGATEEGQEDREGGVVRFERSISQPDRPHVTVNGRSYSTNRLSMMEGS